LDALDLSKAARLVTKCIIHGADKEDLFLFLAQRHGLYINVRRKRNEKDSPTKYLPVDNFL
jgi:hypothetical protein